MRLRYFIFIFFQDGKFIKGYFGDVGNENFPEEYDEFVDEDDSDWGNWKNSEVLKISDCDELEINLDSTVQEELASGDGNEDAKQSILIVENIKKLKLSLSMGESDNGRVRNMSEILCILQLYCESL